MNMTNRGGTVYSDHNINGLGTYGPQIPIRITVDQYPQFREMQGYTVRASTPDTIPTIIENDERERRRSVRPSLMNSVSNLQSSNPSPDEIVIKGRGRRSLPLKWSPIPIESPQKTPLSSLIRKSPKKGGLITLRSSPRKRLQLNDCSTDIAHSRKALLNSSPLCKKSAECESHSKSPSDGRGGVSELSKDQLVHVLNSIMDKHPQIKDEIGTILDSKSSTAVSTRKNKTANMLDDPIDSNGASSTSSEAEVSNDEPSTAFSKE